MTGDERVRKDSLNQSISAIETDSERNDGLPIRIVLYFLRFSAHLKQRNRSLLFST